MAKRPKAVDGETPFGRIARKEDRWLAPPANVLVRLRSGSDQKPPGSVAHELYRVAFAPVRRVNS